MTMNTPHDVPHVEKEPISLVAIGDATLETVALRGVLECLNYRVEVHWVGSRKEALEILRGNIETFTYVILSCHGDEHGGILVPGEPAIGIDDLAVSLPGRVVINTGCGAGQDKAAGRFLDGGCRAYIAPREAVEGSAALLFAAHLFYFLRAGRPLTDALGKAQGFDDESGLFNCWQTAE
jgi:hypothetical protein